MRIAVPVNGEDCVSALATCGTIKLYEDDHGRIVRQSSLPAEGGALRAIERCGVERADCLIFEDSASGIAAALASGCQTLCVKRGMPV